MLYELNDIIVGKIKKQVKGGYLIENEIPVFLPFSEVKVGAFEISERPSYIGREMEFLVVQVSLVRQNIVVSAREIEKREIEKKQKEVFSKLELGDGCDSEIVNLMDYGLFCDIGSLVGLLHRNELDDDQLPVKEHFEKGQKLYVYITEKDEDNGRVSFGLQPPN
jgi:small subunit ribosomal protein S1